MGIASLLNMWKMNGLTDNCQHAWVWGDGCVKWEYHPLITVSMAMHAVLGVEAKDAW